MEVGADWAHYRAFLAVMSEGSLNAAARVIASSAPTLGRHIEALEASLGVMLFTRSQNGLSPTAAALEIEPHARAMSAAADALVRTASGARQEDRGTVRVTAGEILATEVLPQMLTSFRRAHPEIELELAVTNATEDLLRRDADIAIRSVKPEQEAIVAQRMGKITIGIYAHRDYVKRFGVPRSLDALEGHTVIGFDRGQLLKKLIDHTGVAIDRKTFSFRTDSDLAQLAALRAGLGIGGCQTQIAARSPELVRILPDQFRLELEIWLAMHRDQRAVRRVRALFDHLKIALGDFLAG